jgi:hypothetical protein
MISLSTLFIIMFLVSVYFFVNGYLVCFTINEYYESYKPINARFVAVIFLLALYGFLIILSYFTYLSFRYIYLLLDKNLKKYFYGRYRKKHNK